MNGCAVTRKLHQISCARSSPELKPPQKRDRAMLRPLFSKIAGRAVAVAVGVGVNVAVSIAVGVAVAVGSGVGVNVAVTVAVGVNVAARWGRWCCRSCWNGG